MAWMLSGKELEEALIQYCKHASSSPDPALTASDASFAQGIGGTKADHLAEKVLVPCPCFSERARGLNHSDQNTDDG